MSYDSTQDTLNHIGRVQEFLNYAAEEFERRGLIHDQSKLQSPEKEAFDKFTPLLKGSTYGSDEYKQYLEDLKPALSNHYAKNSHHPEHYENGIHGMDLFDVMEMFFDWKAASERHEDGDIIKSIEYNEGRFNMSLQLKRIFLNTVERLPSVIRDPK